MAMIPFTQSSHIIKAQDPPIVEAKKLNEIGSITITAYTLGRVEENDDSPCIGAYGDDLCEVNRTGIKTCASNFIEYMTEIKISYGDKDIYCVVMDRMNSRFKDRVDIAFTEYEEAIRFGKRSLMVSIVVE